MFEEITLDPTDKQQLNKDMYEWNEHAANLILAEAAQKDMKIKFIVEIVLHVSSMRTL